MGIIALLYANTGFVDVYVSIGGMRDCSHAKSCPGLSCSHSGHHGPEKASDREEILIQSQGSSVFKIDKNDTLILRHTNSKQKEILFLHTLSC